MGQRYRTKRVFPQTSNASSLPASSWRMGVPCRTTTFRRNPPSTLSCASEVASVHDRLSAESEYNFLAMQADRDHGVELGSGSCIGTAPSHSQRWPDSCK